MFPAKTSNDAFFRNAVGKHGHAPSAPEKKIVLFFRVFPLPFGKRVHCLTEGGGGLDGGCLFFLGGCLFCGTPPPRLPPLGKHRPGTDCTVFTSLILL